jgi:SsrA-binding protein
VEAKNGNHSREGSKLKSGKKRTVAVAEKTKEGVKILSDNRAARHNYALSDRLEAGLVLSGTEVKAARDGKIQLKDAFGEVTGNEAWLCNAHIGQYSHGNIMNHEPVRKRKLLLHREEISKLQRATREKGLTLVPTQLYLKHGLIKVELAIGRGKKLHDKRESEREREMQDEARAGLRRRNRD